MEIIHLWVRNLRGVENVNYCFTSRFEVAVSLDVSNSRINVKIEAKSDKIEGFYGNNFVNINCIVGANGAGKTTLLQLLSEILTKQFKYGIREYLLVYYDEETKSFTCTHNLNSSVNPLERIAISGDEEKRYEVDVYVPEGFEFIGHKLKKRDATVFYTPIVNFSEWHADDLTTNLIDVSTDSLLRKDLELVHTEIDLIENHRLSNFQRQIALSQKFAGSTLIDEFTLPDTLILSSLEPLYDEHWQRDLSHSYRNLRIYFLGGETAGDRGIFDENVHEIGGKIHALRDELRTEGLAELSFDRTVQNFLRNFIWHYFSMMNRDRQSYELDAEFDKGIFINDGSFSSIRQFFENENWLKDGGQAARALLDRLEDFFKSESISVVKNSTDYSKFNSKNFEKILDILQAQEEYFQSFPGIESFDL